jgi:hypothetical protein
MFLAFMSAARIYGGKFYLSQIVNLGVYKIEDEFSCIFLKGIIFPAIYCSSCWYNAYKRFIYNYNRM